MSKYRNKQQWMELITECRQSGMTDMDWCRMKGISRSSFYNAILRLRKAACELPEPSKITSKEINLTSNTKPDIVPISIIPDNISDAKQPQVSSSSYTMEIVAGGITIKVSNEINISVLSYILKLIGGTV